jgi:predicted  nucleic acid-binding Zn-ribbon protein
MEEQLGLLIQLQELDTNIRSLAEQKKRLPEILSLLERRRAENLEQIDAAKEALQTAQKNKRERDKDLEADVQKVEKLKARTSEIKNNKEYQALLKEIETAEQENKKVEDEILALMEKIDAAGAQITVAETRAKEEESAIAAEQKQHEADFAKVEEELKEVERARKALVGQVQASILTHYQNLLATKAGIAMAEARAESCSGCYMSIPPQVFVNVKKNESIITCPNCHRILYYKETIKNS